ncbi:hypothetical protein ACKWTF_000181 [Chironomus riparius]
MNRLILAVFLPFLVLPIKCELNFGENAFASIKSFFGFDEKPYIPTGTNQNNAAFIEPKDGSFQCPKCYPSSEINYLDEIKLNTTEWKCIDIVLRNATKDHGNFTSLLLTATGKKVLDRIMDCYAVKSEDIDWFGWWHNFTQSDFWKLVTDHYWYIIIAALISLVVITCCCKLCCVLCKKKRDDDFLE